MSVVDERTVPGEQLFDAVYGGVVPLPPREVRGAYVDNTINHLFGEVWTRDILSIEQRRLLILGAVIALGETDIAEIQIRAALAKGELTIEQVEEIRVFMVNYVGHPRMASFAAAMGRALAAHREKGGG